MGRMVRQQSNGMGVKEPAISLSMIVNKQFTIEYKASSSLLLELWIAQRMKKISKCSSRVHIISYRIQKLQECSSLRKTWRSILSHSCSSCRKCRHLWDKSPESYGHRPSGLSHPLDILYFLVNPRSLLLPQWTSNRYTKFRDQSPSLWLPSRCRLFHQSSRVPLRPKKRRDQQNIEKIRRRTGGAATCSSCQRASTFQLRIPQKEPPPRPRRCPEASWPSQTRRPNRLHRALLPQEPRETRVITKHISSLIIYLIIASWEN